MLGPLVVVTLFLGIQCALDPIEQQITSNGYSFEKHDVTTSDGYILALHRIPHGKNSTKSTGRVLFLMHSAPFSSDSFVYIGPESAIAYNFADAGYDVWMGNARGNRYSRRHTSLDPDKDKIKFFDFSYEQIALLDLPAMFDYVLSTTKQDKLDYVAHSLGGTVFLVLNSMNTTYQSKIASAHLLAGMGFQNNFPNTIINELSEATDVIYTELLQSGNVELKPINLTSLYIQVFVNSAVPDVLDAGTSVKQIAHLGQNIRDKTFRRWDFGTTQNTQNYGTASPPSYDLSTINVDVTFHYSVNDKTQSESDVLAMVKAIPNAKASKINSNTFGNIDYLTNNSVKTLVTDVIIQSLANSN